MLLREETSRRIVPPADMVAIVARSLNPKELAQSDVEKVSCMANPSLRCAIRVENGRAEGRAEL